MRSRTTGLGRFALVLGVVLVFASGVAGADELEDEPWRTRPHHLSLIVGGTSNEEATAFTLGLDYEYRVNSLLGLGAVAEHAFERIDATTLLAVVDVHLWRGLGLQTGPGVEFLDDEDVFVYRLGLLYEFEFGRYTVAPQTHVDLTDNEAAIVFGLAFGSSF